MSTFTYAPSYSAQLNVAPRVRNARFGDGYMQRTADGINTKPRSWGLRFTGATSRINAIESFLDGESGVTSFDWTPPTGDAGKWICQEWSRSIDDFNNEVLNATFREVFGE